MSKYKDIKKKFDKEFPLIELEPNKPVDGDFIISRKKYIWDFIVKALESQREKIIKEVPELLRVALNLEDIEVEIVRNILKQGSKT